MFNGRSRTLADLPKLHHGNIGYNVQFVEKTSRCFAHALCKLKIQRKTLAKIRKSASFQSQRPVTVL